MCEKARKSRAGIGTLETSSQDDKSGNSAAHLSPLRLLAFRRFFDIPAVYVPPGRK